MPNVKVVTDSTCDLPQDVLDDNNITVVPLTVRFGNDEFVDGQDLSPAEFWQRCETFDSLPTTAAPSPGAFESAFRAAADSGHDAVVCINISSELSATAQSAALAATAVADTIPVEVIDSRWLTTALGTIAQNAASAARNGASAAEVTDAVRNLIPRMHLYAALDTLENLKKGGRIGSAKALVGTLLSIKPVITVKEGAVHEEAKPRTRSKALAYLADKVAAAGGVEDVWVMHGAASDVSDLVERLQAHVPTVRVGDIGAVIGTHAGRGVIGVTFAQT